MLLFSSEKACGSENDRTSANTRHPLRVLANSANPTEILFILNNGFCPLLTVVPGLLCASIIALILKGTAMRSILGLIVTVVVIVIVLRFMGVL